MHPVCPGDVLSVVTQIVTAGSQDAFLLSKDSLSPFRHRLRIALTPAVAIEGDGGRGDTLLPNLSTAHLQTILTHPQKLVTNQIFFPCIFTIYRQISFDSSHTTADLRSNFLPERSKRCQEPFRLKVRLRSGCFSHRGMPKRAAPRGFTRSYLRTSVKKVPDTFIVRPAGEGTRRTLRCTLVANRSRTTGGWPSRSP